MDNITEKIWNDYYKELKSFTLKKVKDEDIANDILQDVFLKIISNSDKITHATNLRQYVYGITRNATIDHFRKAGRVTHIENENFLSSEEEIESLNTTIADCCIKSFIAQLPEKYRQALIRTEFEEVSQKDLAKELDISYSGAKSRVQRGKEKLKALILTCCDFPSDSYGNLQSAKSKNCNCD